MIADSTAYINRVDSLTNAVEKLSNSFEDLNEKLTWSPWVPLVAAVVGGVLVWIGQLLERKSKRKQERCKFVIEIFAGCQTKLFEIKNALNDLASNQYLNELWWTRYQQELAAENTNEYDEKLYYDKCSKHSDSAIAARIKIGDIMAAFSTQMILLKLLLNHNIDLNFTNDLISNLNFETPEPINATENEQQLEEYNTNRVLLLKKHLELIRPLDLALETLKKSVDKIKV